MFERLKWTIIVAAVVIFIGLLFNGLVTFGRAEALRQQNALLREKSKLLEAQNQLLEANKLCLAGPTRTPYPYNDPLDPICGDPSAFKPKVEANDGK